MTEIVKAFRERVPAARLIGKRYSMAEEGAASHWGEWFENGWFYVDYDEVSGYVSGDYLELSASRPQPGGDTSSDGGSSGGSCAAG